MVANFALLYQVHPVNLLPDFVEDLVFAGDLFFQHVEDFLESDRRQALEEGHARQKLALLGHLPLLRTLQDIGKVGSGQCSKDGSLHCFQ